MTLLVVAFAALVAGAIDTVVGFGGGLLLIPILVVMVGELDAVLLTALIPLGWNLARLPLLRSFIDRKALLYLAAGTIPGTILGGLFLDKIDPETLRTAIGVLLVVLGLYHTIRLYVEMRGPSVPEKVALPALGFIGGGINALLGAGNGPIQSWGMSAVGMSPRAIVATGGVLGAVTGFVRLGTYGVDGLWGTMPWTVGLVGTLAAVAGAVIGVRLSRGKADANLKLLIGVAVVIAGIRLLL